MTNQSTYIPGSLNKFIDYLAFHHHQDRIGYWMVKDTLHQIRPLNIGLMWVPCMLSNGLDTAIKVAQVALYTIGYVGMSVLSLATCRQEICEYKNRIGYLLLDGAMTLGIDIIGTLFPYVAYRLDNLLVKNFSQKHFYIHNPYLQRPKDFWSEREMDEWHKWNEINAKKCAESGKKWRREQREWCRNHPPGKEVYEVLGLQEGVTLEEVEVAVNFLKKYPYTSLLKEQLEAYWHLNGYLTKDVID